MIQIRIAITSREITDYLSYGVERERIVLIPNGINPEAFQDVNDDEFRSRYDLDSRQIVWQRFVEHHPCSFSSNRSFSSAYR